MNSRFFLKINDPKIRKEFTAKRHTEILKISSLIFAARMVIFLATVITAITNQRKFVLDQWMTRSMNNFFHFLLLIFTYKFPLVFSEAHSPLLTLTFLINLVQVTFSKLNSAGLVNNVIGFAFFQLSALVTNQRWIYTSIAILAINIGTICFYYLYLNLTETTIIIQYTVVSILCIYSSYQIEYRSKTEYIQMYEIQKMNDDLQGIMMNFPEGIVLYDEIKSKIVLANQEFKRIFNCVQEPQQEENTSLQGSPNYTNDMCIIDEKLNSNVLRPVNFLNQNEQQLPINQENRVTGKYSLREAPLKFADGQCFQIEDEFQEALRNIGVDPNFNKNSPREDMTQKELVTIKDSKILYQSNQLRMISIKSLMPLVRYEKLKLENHFYEMLTATVSHDMRTPLNAMQGLLDSIRLFIQSEKGLKLVQIVDNSSKILLSLVNDLLDFSQIRNGNFKKNNQITDIRKSITDACDIMRLAIIEKGLDLNIQFEENIPEEIIVDGPRINQVVLNLLQNSLKFTQYGYISVMVQFKESAEQLQFMVKDTGQGIKQEDRPKLFTLFGKLENTAHMNTSGIGLGLNICKNIVETLGGTIKVLDNGSEQGTTFIFTIKCNQENGDVQFQSAMTSVRSAAGSRFILNQIEEEETLFNNQNQLSQTINTCMNISNDSVKFGGFEDILCTPSIIASTKKKRLVSHIPCSCQTRTDILVVDDNIFNIVTLQTILEYQFNLRSDKALNGQDAVDIVKQRINMNNHNQCICYHHRANFKLIFMDCNMPIMDGFQATQEIRQLALENNFEVYIVALTAYTTENFKDKSVQYGMDLFINKPVNSQQIKDILIARKLITAASFE
eukprot:403354040